MMSLSAIRQRSEEAAAEAAQEGMEPFVWAFDEVDSRGFPFPFLGTYVPEGWELVDTHFVDSSGLGAENEAALTGRQFAEVISEAIENNDVTVGWGVIDAGQFQVHVGEFHRTD